MKKAGFIIIVAVLVAGILLSACQSSPAPAPPPATSKAAATTAAPPPSAPPAAKPETSAPPTSSAAPKPPAPPAPSTTAAPPPAKVYNMKFASNLPSVHQQIDKVLKPWAAEMEKRTNGQIKITIYADESIGKVGEYYDMVLSGAVDGALVMPSLMQGKFPLDEIFHLPFLIPGDTSNPLGNDIRHALYDKYLIPIHFSKTKPLWNGRFGVNVLNMVKKPVRTLEDMSGLVIGFPGGQALLSFLKTTGAAVESVNVVDMYTSLQRKTIDGQVIPLEALVAFKLSEIVKYITFMNVSGASFIHVMRQETWNGLPPDLQKVVTELNPWAEDIQMKAWGGMTGFATSVAKQNNIELITLTPQEAERWVAKGKPLEAEWVKATDAKNLPASAMYKLVQDMLAAAAAKPATSPAAK